MNTRHRSLLMAALLVTLAACSSGSGTTTLRGRRLRRLRALEPGGDDVERAESDSAAQDVMGLAEFAPLDPGTYFIDPDLDPSTPLRVTYEVPSEGWAQWTGAVKWDDDGQAARCGGHHHRDEPGA